MDKENFFTIVIQHQKTRGGPEATSNSMEKQHKKNYGVRFRITKYTLIQIFTEFPRAFSEKSHFEKKKYKIMKK